MKTLPKNLSDYLLTQPETGMDYQVVRVTLADGTVFEDVAIVHQSIVGEVRGHSDIPFDPDFAAKVEVTHNKWEFRRRSDPKADGQL
jgi:hypothetical protein